MLPPLPEGPEPLQRRGYCVLRDAMLAGQLRPGQRLPPTRTLAQAWGVSRNTALAIYEQLLAEGYVRGQVGAGTFVADALPEPADIPPPNVEPRRSGLARRVGELAALGGRRRLGPPRPFAIAHPALDHFPFALWGQLLARQWRDGGARLARADDPAGYLPLRQAVAEHLAASRGVRCEAAQVLIVSGAQQALDLVARLLLDPGDAVWVEEPGYLGVRAALLAAGARLVPVPVDGEGLDVAAGERQAKQARAVLTTPSYQFPLGVTMSLARRLQLLDWARRADAWVIEDDYDSDFHYEGPPMPALQGLDRAGRVVYVGTFSKAMFPSLRLGYLVLPPDLCETAAEVRSFIDGGVSVVHQAAMARFMAEGHHAAHLRRMRQLYGRRRRFLLEALARHPSLLEPLPGQAGMHLTVALAPGLDERAVVAAAARRGLVCQPLSGYCLERPARTGLVLGFAGFDEAELERAVALLAEAAEEAGRNACSS